MIDNFAFFTYFRSNQHRKNVQDYLVETNCDKGALAKSMKSPELEQFQYPLPREVLSGGQHRLLVDPTEQYFGIRLQKKSIFSNRALVTSMRSREIQREKQAEEEQKKKFANQILDEEAQYQFCQKMLDQLNDKRKLKRKKEEQLEEEKQREDFAVEIQYDDDDESEHDQEEAES